MAPLSFSLRYAAPEVVEAFEARQKSILVDPAMDLWAFGLMAYELLTDEPAFPPGATVNAVKDQIIGRAPLPWEDAETQDAKYRKLRMLKRTVIKCLSRDPSERPTATELLASWDRMFDSFAGDKTQIAVP
jgi:serine/threonine protein kinase